MNPTIERYLKLLDREPDNAAALKGLEEAYFLDGAWADLIAFYEKRLKVTPEAQRKAELFYKIGLIYEQRLADASKALTFYEQACQLNPQQAQALERLFKLHNEAQRYPMVLQIAEMLEPLLSKRPKERLNVLHTMIDVYAQRLGRPEMAIDVVEKALDLEPESEPVMEFLRRSSGQNLPRAPLLAFIDERIKRVTTLRHKQRLQYLKAIAHLAADPKSPEAERLLRPLAQTLGPWQIAVAIDLVDLLLARGEADEARRMLKIAAQAPKTVDFSLVMAQRGAKAAASLADESTAEIFWRRVIEAKPGHLEAFEFLQGVLRRRGDDRGLVELLAQQTQASTDAKQRNRLFREMGEIFRGPLKNPQKAIRCFERVVQDEPDNFEVTVMLAAACEEAGDMQKAQALWRKVQTQAQVWEESLQTITDEGQRSQRYLDLARLYRSALKDESRAVVALKKSLAANSANDEASRELESIYRARQNWGDLLHLLMQRPLENMSREQRLLHLKNVGSIWEDKFDDAAKAFEAFESARALAPHDESLLMRLRLLARRLQKPEAHLQYVQALLQLPSAREKTPALELVQEALESCALLSDRGGALRLTLLENLVELDPNQSGAFDELEDYFQQQGEWKRLAELTQQSLERIKSPELKAQRSIRLARLVAAHLADDLIWRDRLAAIWDQARRLDPSQVEPLEALFQLHLERENWAALRPIAEDLDRLYLDAGQFERWQEFAVQYAGLLEEKMTDLAASAAMWDRLRRQAGAAGASPQPALEALERLYRRLEKWHELSDMLRLQSEMAQDPNVLSRLYRELGRVLMEHLGDQERGMGYFEKALAIDPQQLELWDDLKAIVRGQGNWPALADLLVRQLSETTLSPRKRYALLLELAEIYGERLERFAEALDLYGEIINADPEHRAAIEGIVRVCARSGDRGTQAEALKKLLSLAQRQGDRDLEVDVLERLLRDGRWIDANGEMQEEDLENFARQLLRLRPGHAHALGILEEKAAARGAWGEVESLLLQRKAQATTSAEGKAILLRLAVNASEHLLEPTKAFGYHQAIVDAYEADINVDDIVWLEALLSHQRVRGDAAAFLQTAAILSRAFAQSNAPKNLRRALMVESAQGWERLGEHDRARKSYEEALLLFEAGDNDGDEAAAIFEALRTLLIHGESWSDLLAALRARERDVSDPLQKSILLAEMADVEANRLGHPDVATELYQRAFELDPGDSKIFAVLQHLYEAAGDWKPLIELLEYRAEHLRDLKEVARLQTQAGRIWEEKLGDRLEASLCYQKALELAPKGFEDDWTLERLIEIYDRQHNHEGLVKVLSLKVSRQAQAAEKVALLLRIGALQEDELAQPEEAFRSYRQAFLLDAQNKAVLQALARLALETARVDEAVTYLQRLSALEPLDHDGEPIRLRLRLADLLQNERSDLESALKVYQEITEAFPFHLETLKHMHRLYTALERWPDLVATYERILPLIPDPEERIPLFLRLSEVQQHNLGDIEAAAETLRQALESAPENTGVIERYGALLQRLERWQDVVDLERRRLERVQDPGQGYEIVKNIAVILDERLQRPEEAAAYYKKLAEGRDDQRALWRLTEILEARGEERELERVYRLLLDQSLAPIQRETIRHRLAHLLVHRLDRIEEGMELYDEILQAAGDSPDLKNTAVAAAVSELTLYYERRVETPALLRLLPLRMEIAASPDERISVGLQYAALLEGNGQKAEALSAYRQAGELAARSGFGALRLTAVEGQVRIFQDQQDWPALRVALHEVIALAPENPEPRLWLGQMLLDRLPGEESAREALEQLEEVILLQPLDLQARHQLNRALGILRLWPRWLDSVKAEIVLQPNVEEKAHLWREVAHVLGEELDNSNEAVEALKQAFVLTPQNPEIGDELESRLSAAGRLEEATQVLVNAAEAADGLERKQALICRAVRRLYEQSEQADHAAEIRRLLKMSLVVDDPGHPHRETYQLWMELNRSEKKTVHDDAELAAIYVTYFNHFGAEENAEFFYRWAQTLADHPDYQAVRFEALRRTLERNPDHKEANRQMGFMLLEREEIRPAFEAWQRYLGEDMALVYDQRVLRSYIFCAEKLNRYDEFCQAAARLVELHAADPALVLSLVKIVGHLQKPELLQKALGLILDQEELSSRLSHSLLAFTAFVLARSLEKSSASDAELIRRYRTAADFGESGSEIKAESLFRLGQIFQKLKQRHQAVKAFEEVLQEHERAVARSSGGETPDGLGTIEMFSGLPADYVPHWVEPLTVRLSLAQLLEGHDDRRSAEHYWVYFLSHSEDRALTEKLSAWYEAWNDHQRLANLLAIAVSHVPTHYSGPGEANADRKWRCDGYRRLAAVRMRALEDADGARKAFEEVVRLAPDDEEAHMALAVLYDQSPHRHAKAVETHEWLIARDPLRIASYRSLLRHYRELGKPERAMCIAEILVLLGEANREEKILAEAIAQRSPPLRPGTISQEARERYLAHPVQKEYLSDLFHLLHRGLDKVYKFRLEKYGLSKADLVRDDAPAAVAAIAERARAIFRAFGGGDLRLYWDRSAQDRFVLENDKVPALIVSSDFLPLLTDVEQNFLMGRILQYALDGFIILQKARRKSLEKTLNALVKMMDADSTVMVSMNDDDEDDELEKTSSKLARKMKRELRPLIEKHLNPSTHLELKTWLAAVHATANRGGLVACGSLQIAADFLTEEADLSPQNAPEVYRQQIRDSKPLRDLVVYAASSQYFALRDLMFGS